MKKLAVISAGIIALVGAPLAVAIVGGEDANKSNATPHNNTEGQSSVQIDMDSSLNMSDVETSNSASLNVNGQNIPVPENGEVHREITSDGQSTNVRIRSSSTQGNATNSNSTNLNISVNSESSSSTSND